MSSKHKQEYDKQYKLNNYSRLICDGKKEIILDIKENDKNDEYFGICKFLQESYKKTPNIVNR